MSWQRGFPNSQPEDVCQCETQVRSNAQVVLCSEEERRGRVAQSRVQRGQVSRARQELTGASLVPKNQAFFDELQNKRPQNQVGQIPRHVLEFNPVTLLNLDVKKFVPGPGGCTNEMWRVFG